jgi:hypothetical protein
MLPVHVECKTGAVVLGNENTRSIITVKFTTANGTFNAGHAGPLDAYKIIFAFDVVHPIITLKPNLDFKEFQLAAAARLKNASPPDKPHVKSKRKRLLPRFRLFTSSGDSVRASSLSDANGVIFGANVPGLDRWQGLSRYLDDNFHNEHDEWEGVEYARTSVLADCPKIAFAFFWDVPGQVQESRRAFDEEFDAHVNHINGSPPPEYGMDILIYGGTVNYGPWTDRHRINFQHIFFPPVYANAMPGKPVSPGGTRISTEFKLFLSIE